MGAIALSYPPRVRVRATVKLSAVFFHDESSITIGGYESAIAPKNDHNKGALTYHIFPQIVSHQWVGGSSSLTLRFDTS